jgi:hypothetical protein
MVSWSFFTPPGNAQPSPSVRWQNKTRPKGDLNSIPAAIIIKDQEDVLVNVVGSEMLYTCTEEYYTSLNQFLHQELGMLCIHKEEYQVSIVVPQKQCPFAQVFFYHEAIADEMRLLPFMHPVL